MYKPTSRYKIYIIRNIPNLSKDLNRWVVITNLWSMDTRLRSSLCLLLNMTSLCGISSKDGGPNGVHSANSPKGGGSSDLRFWPWITLIRPRTSSLCIGEKKLYLLLLHIMKNCTNDRKTRQNGRIIIIIVLYYIILYVIHYIIIVILFYQKTGSVVQQTPETDGETPLQQTAVIRVQGLV